MLEDVEIAAHFKSPWAKGFRYLKVGQYPSGEPMVKEDEWVYPVERVLLRPKNAVQFLGGIFWVQSLIDRGMPAPELVIPNMFGARQDRSNPTGDVLFTARNVAKLINSLGCPKVIVLDPHSEVTPALIDRCVTVHADEIFKLRRVCPTRQSTLPDAVVSPDAGAEKRAGAVAKLFGVPLLHAWKTRDVKDGKITGFGIEPCDEYRYKRLLIVDDLCDGGGTFIGLNSKLPAGSIADLYVTHGLFTQGTANLKTCFQNIYCTDSTIADRQGVAVFEVCAHLLQHGV